LCFDVWSVFSLGMLISYGTESGCGHWEDFRQKLSLRLKPCFP
jgi:hypothetical protein